ncbi:MAG: hypothetical protein AAFN74_23095 [Myxococcota bacterium]
MIEIILAMATGLLAGGVHVVSGPDHLAAVVPFAVDAPKRALRLGMLWGVGHGVGVLVLGAIFVALRQVVDVEQISHWAEGLVGILLVLLGLWALRRSRLVVVHHHVHTHQEEVRQEDGHRAEGVAPADKDEHAHHHVHFNDPTVGRDQHIAEGRHRFHNHSTMGFGFVHGLAGAGHLVVASPVIALGAWGASAYLLSYLVGGMGAMTIFAYGAGALVRRPTWIPHALRVAGAGSVVVGLFWMTTFSIQ